MERCPSESELLEFLEGRTSDSDGRAFANHLSGCWICRQRVGKLSDDDTLRSYFRLHEQTPHGSPPQSLTPVREKLKDRVAEARRTLEWSGASPQQPEPEIPKTLGRYQLENKLGSGSYGVVYRARDTQLLRTVALKMPRCLTLSDPFARERFFREAKAAAGLHHPQIAALYDAGEYKGICFLASEFTDGPTLGEWTGRQEQILHDDAARITLALAEAVEHAHANGVLHRDIKPHNVLLDSSTRYRGLPFTPKLTDFSIAKLVEDDSSQTMTGMLLGTPRYIAPELAAGRRSELGPACDIYGLGVILYELLTGRVPIDGDGQVDTLRRVITEDPVPPRRLSRDIPRDLEAICLTCLHKDPRRRYASADELAADLKRFLQREPTIARPIQLPERIGRWIRREPTRAAIIGFSMLTALLIVAGLAFHTQRLKGLNTDLSDTNSALQRAVSAAESAGNLARQHESDMRQLLYVSDMRLAGRARREGDFREVTRLLERHIPVKDDTDRRGIEWYYLAGMTHARPREITRISSAVYQTRLSPEGDRLAVVGADGIVRFIDPVTGELLDEYDPAQGELNGVDFSPDGTLIATAGDDGTVSVRSSADFSESLRITAFPELAFYALFTSDGRRLVTCGIEDEIHLWDVESGDHLGSLEGNLDRVEAIAVSPDGRWAASGSRDGSARLWDLTTLKEKTRIRNRYPYPRVMAVAFSDDSSVMVAGDRNRALWVWDTESKKLIAKGHHLDAFSAVLVSPDGRWIVTGDDVGTVCLWDLASARGSERKPNGDAPELPCVRQWQAHEQGINSIQFLSDGEFITAGSDGRIQAWTVAAPTTDVQQMNLPGVVATAFTADGRLLAMEREHSIRWWNPAADPALQKPTIRECEIHHLDVNRDGTVLAVSHMDGTIEIMDMTSPPSDGPGPGRLLQSWQIEGERELRAVTLSADGRRLSLTIVAPVAEVLVFETDSGRLLHQARFPEVALSRALFTSDGRRIVINYDDDLLVWPLPDEPVAAQDVDTISGLVRIPSTHTILNTFALSPDDSLLASGGLDRQLKLWDPDTGAEVRTLSGHLDSVDALTFSPDGKSLVSASRNCTIKVWNVAAGEELLDLYRMNERLPTELTFSPDGRWLSCIYSDRHWFALLECRSPRLPDATSRFAIHRRP